MNVVSNIGASSGQSVFHPHVHLVPREEEETEKRVKFAHSAKEMMPKEEGDAMVDKVKAALQG